METFKILKYRTPASVYKLFTTTNIPNKHKLHLPKIKFDKTKHNFVFSASKNWNIFCELIFEKCFPKSSGVGKGIVVPGSSRNSDLSATISFAKQKIKQIILTSQKSGNEITWS